MACPFITGMPDPPLHGGHRNRCRMMAGTDWQRDVLWWDEFERCCGTALARAASASRTRSGHQLPPATQRVDHRYSVAGAVSATALAAAPGGIRHALILVQSYSADAVVASDDGFGETTGRTLHQLGCPFRRESLLTPAVGASLLGQGHAFPLPFPDQGPFNAPKATMTDSMRLAMGSPPR